VLPLAEFLSEIDALVLDGFVAQIGDSVSRSNEPDIAERAAPDRATNGSIHLDDEIILSEAKFLLVDFSADAFETQSRAFIDEIIDGIYACKSVKDFRLRLSAIFAATEKLCPDRLPVLLELVKKINETA